MKNLSITDLRAFITFIVILVCFFPDIRFPDIGINLGNVFLLLGCLFLLLISFLLKTKYKIKYKLSLSDKIMFIFLIFCLLSTIWSIDKKETLQQSIFILIFLFTLTNIAPLIESSNVVKFTTVISLCICLLSLALYLAGLESAFQSTSSTGGYELRGIIIHQLRLGIISGIASGLLIISFINRENQFIISRSKLIILCIFIVIILTLFLSKTRLYTLFLFMSLFFTWTMTRSYFFRFTVLFVFIFSVLLFILNSTFILSYLEFIGIDTTLTTRTLIWDRTLLIIANSNVNELLGFGFASFGSGDFDIYFPYYRPPHPHSSFISVIFETGYIGFLLIIIYVVVQIKEIQNRQGNKKLSYSAFLIFFTVLGSLTGANIASKLSLLFSLMLLFSIIENHNHAQHKRP